MTTLYLNTGPPEYETGVLAIRSQRSVWHVKAVVEITVGQRKACEVSRGPTRAMRPSKAERSVIPRWTNLIL
jgi:hypothetical protein